MFWCTVDWEIFADKITPFTCQEQLFTCLIFDSSLKVMGEKLFMMTI